MPNSKIETDISTACYLGFKFKKQHILFKKASITATASVIKIANAYQMKEKCSHNKSSCQETQRCLQLEQLYKR